MRPVSPVDSRHHEVSARGVPSFPAAAERGRSSASWSLATRVVGALATLAVGAVHLQQYFKLYSAVPTIGTLFVLNFVGATVIGLALLAPIERMAGRLGRSAVTLLAVAATKKPTQEVIVKRLLSLGVLAGKTGVIARPDGARQVTVDGKPLYTFSEDAPGKVEGNGFSDDLDGRHFTWNAVLAGGDSAGSSGGANDASPGNDYGY
jgi:hypothetical protein